MQLFQLKNNHFQKRDEVREKMIIIQNRWWIQKAPSVQDFQPCG